MKTVLVKRMIVAATGAAAMIASFSTLSQTIEVENEDAFIVKVSRGFFSSNSPESRHERKRKGWSLVMAKSKEMGCTHLAGISTALSQDLKALIRGSLVPSRMNASWDWTRPNGGIINVMEKPQHLVDFDYQGSGFACSRGEPQTAVRWFRDMATLERELRFEELID